MNVKTQKEQLTLRIALNGTKENRLLKMYGLKKNPLPQLPSEYRGAESKLSDLGGDPIPNVGYIRDHLKGFDPEFVEFLCERFVPGEYTTFTITFPREGEV